MDLVELIEAKREYFQSQPSLELVVKIMDPYWQEDIEQCEEAGDARHEEMPCMIHVFLSLSLVTHLLSGSSTGDGNSAHVSSNSCSCAPDSQENQSAIESVDPGTAFDNALDNIIDDVISSLLGRCSSPRYAEHFWLSNRILVSMEYCI